MKHFLGVDLGGTNIAMSVVDEENRMLHKCSIRTKRDQSFAETTREICETAKNTLREAGLAETDIEFVGFGVPSTLEPGTRHLTYANNLGWVGVDLIGEFQKHWDIPVRVANDADCAALGEALCGAAAGYSDVLMVTLGTGVGSGIIMDGAIFEGSNGYGCEAGHMIVAMDGTDCTCGNKGCYEAYASVTGLIAQTRAAMDAHPGSLLHEVSREQGGHVSGRTAYRAAAKGDRVAQGVIDTYAHYVGVGIANLVTIFLPQIVIVGGGVSNEGDLLLGPVRRTVEACVYGGEYIKLPPVVKAELGNDAGIIGAARLG